MLTNFLYFRRIIALCLSLVLSNLASSQSYLVKITTEPYDSLTQYESLSDNGVELYFSRTEFELPWNFPFFDEEYNLLNYNEFSYGSFNSESTHSFYPLYLFDNFWGRYNLEPNSDYRYGQSSADNVCFEWRNIGSFTSPDDDIGERGLATFKTCFWKNGDIDLHFGDLVFNNTLYDSLFTYPGLNGYSPYIAVTNPKDVDEAIILSTDPSNPHILDKWDFFNTEKPPFIKKLPPKDLKIRFSLRRTSAEDESYKPFKIQNPVTSNITIPDNFVYDEYAVFNANAELVINGTNPSNIDVHNLTPGVYFLFLSEGWVKYKYKFVKL